MNRLTIHAKRLGPILLAVLVFSTAPVPAAHAQDPDSARADTTVYVLPPLVVDVERERSAPPPVASLVVPPEIIRRSQESDPYRVLRQTAGVEVHDQGQGPGFASNVVMRGFTSDHSSDVLLVIDGVPVNLPAHGHVEGYADWNVLMPRAVSSMRVIHGGASPLYGDFALGGVVEVFTRADAEGLEGTLGGSSFGDFRADLAGGRRGEDSGFFVGGATQRNEGWRENSDYWLANGLVRGWRHVGEGRLEGGLALYGTDWNSPGFVSIPRFNDRDLDAASDPTDGGDSRRAVLSGRYAVPLTSSAHLQATAWGLASRYALFLNIPDHVHDGATGVTVQSGEWDERTGAGAQAEIGLTRTNGDAVLGISGRSDWVEYRHAATFDRTVLNREIDLGARHTAGALYGRLRHQFGDALGVDLGARLDVLRHRSRSRLNLVDAWESSTNTVFSPKLGLRYRLDPRVSFRASTARGFRSPVGIVGDPSREPYLSWSHEVGVDLERPGLSTSLSLFRIDVSNERIQDPLTFEISSAGSSTRQGAEALVAMSLGERIGLQVRSTYNHARLSGAYANAHDDHPHTVFGGAEDPQPVPANEDDARRVPGIADFQGSVRMSGQLNDELSAWASWRAVGPHVPIGEATVETQSYSVADLGASWSFGDGRAVDVELLNLSDQRYIELRSSGFVVPGVPRSLRVQVRFGAPTFH